MFVLQQLPHHNQQPQYTQVKNGMDIPGAIQVKEEVGGGVGGILDPGPKPVLLKIDEAQDLFANFTGGVINQVCVAPLTQSFFSFLLLSQKNH